MTTETSAKAALETFEHDNFDVIVSDYQMPNMDGIGFLEQVRAKDQDVPFILFTGRGREEVAINALNIGADFYIKKGGDSESLFAVLASTIRQAVKNRNAETALIYNTRRFRYLIENISDVVALVGDDGDIDYIGPSATKVLSIPPGSLMGRPLSGLVIPDDKDIVLDTFRNSIDDKSGKASCEVRVPTPKGEKCFELISSALRDEGGSKFIVNLRDITDRKAYERSMQRRMELEKVINEVGIEFINPSSADGLESGVGVALGSVAQVLGVDRAQVLTIDWESKRMELINSWSIRSDDDPCIKRIQYMGNRPWNGLLTLNSPICIDREDIEPDDPLKGFLITHNFRTMVLLPIKRHGVVTGVTCFETESIPKDWEAPELSLMSLFGEVMGNVQDRLQSNRDLELAHHKTTLLGHVTRHDILNQVAVIKGYLGLMTGQSDPEKVKRYIDKLTKAANKIQRQLDFNREYEMMGQEKPMWVDVASMVRDLGGQLQLTNVELRVETSDLEILADPLVEKAFMNIMSNSIDHGEGITLIRVCIENDTGVSIVFQDDGVGIKSEEKELIFNHGYGRNYGYGLHLVREILGITGMTIKEVGQPGKGARFTIHVPERMYRGQCLSTPKR